MVVFEEEDPGTCMYPGGDDAVAGDDRVSSVVFGCVNHIECVTTTHDVGCALTRSPWTVVVGVEAH